MNEVLKAIKSRRSVRAYTEQQISPLIPQHYYKIFFLST